MKHLIKITSISLMLSILALTGFASIEPAFAQAASAVGGTTVNLNVDAAISITSSATTTTSMSTSLNLTTSSAIATTTWNVKTNSATGYTLSLASGTTTTPAMKQPANNLQMINDYKSAYAAPSTWAPTNNSAEFGYSAFGTHAINVASDKFNATGVSNCGATSTANTTLKYASVVPTANTIATYTSTTTTAGVDTTVCWAVAQTGNFYIASGAYQASAIATAVTQ
jgi:hypothetical protein